MAIPSGGGTEVLKRNSIPAQTTTWTEIDWASEQTSAGNTSGTTATPTNQIITVLNMIFCNGNASERGVYMKVSASGRTDVPFLDATPVPGKGTFAFNDRLVLHPGDKLMFYSSGADVQIWINYILQDWT